jgi:hypothetical protein
VIAARIAMLALAIVLFSFAIHERANAGQVFGATVLLGDRVLGNHPLGAHAWITSIAARRASPPVTRGLTIGRRKPASR